MLKSKINVALRDTKKGKKNGPYLKGPNLFSLICG
jgi:hypothetical protein